MLGKRNQYLFDYKIGLSAEGKIQAIEASLYADGGWSMSDVDSMFATVFGQSCYKVPAARMTPYGVRLDTCPPTATRAPAMCNGHAMMEAMMQQGDPIMPPPQTLEDPSPIKDIIAKAKAAADWEARNQQVHLFNAANRWKKRGLSLVPMRYDHSLRGWGLKMHCLISVFGLDGTISVAHNGIEMGQGMNTKVAQVVAHSLGVPIDLIQIKPVTALTNPNGSTTGGSAGSETNCLAAIGACDILKAR